VRVDTHLEPGVVGLVDNLAGRVELDEFLRPRAWK
jgi:hypothetical protein